MSLINQMLQDLDQRRASGMERGPLPNQVRALPRASRAVYPWRPAALATGALLIAALGWQLGRQPWYAGQPGRAVSELPAVQAPVASVPTPQVAPAPPVQSVLAPAPVAAPQPAEVKPPPAAHAVEIKTAPAAPPLARSKPVASPEPVTKSNSRSSAKTQNALPELLSSAAVIGVDAKGAKPEAAAASTEPAKNVSTPPARELAVGSMAPPFVAMPPLTKSAPSIAAADGKSKASNPQIDKRSQELTAREVAENEYRSGATLLGQGRTLEAQEKFRAALNDFPSHSGARQGLFRLLIDAKRTGEAEQLLQEGLRANPSQPGFAMALARMQVDRGETAAAVDTLQKTAHAANGSPDYLAFLAALQQRQSRHNEAVENYQAALRLAPQSAIWMMGLGISLQALHRNADALEIFRRAKGTGALNPELQAFVDQRIKQLQ
jgi:MSHA biogenesis protein MshN